MNTMTRIIAGVLGIAAIVTTVIAVNMVSDSRASASSATISFTPESKSVQPLETFDVTFSLTTAATAADAGFSGAQFTLRFDDGNAGIVDLLGPSDGGKLVITASNMVVIRELKRGSDEKGKYASFTVAVPPETAQLQKTATFTVPFKSLKAGTAQIQIDTTGTEVSGNTGQADLTYAVSQKQPFTLTSGNTAPADKYTVSGTATPNTVVIGSQVTVSVTITTPQTTTGIIDLEIYNENNEKVYQEFFTDQQMTAGQRKTVTSTWQTGSTPAGTYTVKAGVFSSDWQQLYHWSDSVATFTITNAITVAPTKVPTVAPTKKVTVRPSKTPRPTRTPIPTKTPLPTRTPVPSKTPVATKPPAGETFIKGVNLNGPAVTIGGRSWSGSSDTSVVAQKHPFNISWMAFSNTPPEELKQMLGVGYWGGPISISNLSQGNYSVYIYLREDDGNTSINFFLQGQQVATNVQSGAPGSWQKLGPYKATVDSSGTLTISTTGGAALISGIELYKVQ
jgi:hypothetical protein